MSNKNLSKRKPSMKEALIIFLLVLFCIISCINITLELVPALVLGAAIASIGGLYLGFSWKDINDGIKDGIMNGLDAIVIMIIIGMIIGTWILCGAIPTLITFGLDILSPSVFLPVGFLLCIIVSVLVGTSLGTIATMGVVLMGVGKGLGVSQEMTAAVIICGSLFGDKISPMSDSTNVAAAAAGTPLFSNIKSLSYVSIPAALISLIIYSFLGRSELTYGSDLSLIDQIIDVLHANFNISIWTLIPAILVLILLMRKTPAVPALLISFLTASGISMILQGASLKDVLIAAGSGYKSTTGFELIDSLLSQGGVVSMQGTISTILVASAMGGILKKICVLEVILSGIMTFVKKPSHLIITTLFGCLLMMLATGEMVVSMVLVGGTLQPAYDKFGIHRSILSRSIETAGPLFAGVIPWAVVAVYSQDVLGVGSGYIKYSYLPFIALIIAIVYALLGLFIFAANENDFQAPLDAKKILKKENSIKTKNEVEEI